MARKIIGITGFAGSGKNSLANIIHKAFPLNTEIISFGSAVKDVCSVLFDWPRELLEGDTKESRDFRESIDRYWSVNLNQDWTPRKAMQYIGTDLIRNQLSPSFWLDLGMKRIDKSDKVVIIPDVRFRNEIEAIRKKDGIIYRTQLGENPEWFNDVEELNSNIPDLMEKKQLDKVLWTLGEIKRIIPENLHNSEYEWIGYDFPDKVVDCKIPGLDLLKKRVDEVFLLKQVKNLIDSSRKIEK